MSFSAPRLLRNELTKQFLHPAGWSPHALLLSHFPEHNSLTVKRSKNSRFFMYEEQDMTKLDDKDGPTEELLQSPSEFSNSLLLPDDNQHHYYYWTSPVRDVAPSLLQERFAGYDSLHDGVDPRLLDPRGPSLWMGSCGSGTQAHYDVANNVLVQLFGSKRVRCYPPSAVEWLYVFPDAHPRARKSQVNFDHPDLNRFPHFASLPSPVLDVVLRPGDALEIPAFWFHHVENGTIPGISGDLGDEGPSVSSNMFSLSMPMMTAQAIFQKASRPFGVVQEDYDFCLAALRALGFRLFEGLGYSRQDALIRKLLLESRYLPLECRQILPDSHNGKQHELTIEKEQAVAACVEQILPEFARLKEEDNGIVLLVALHLLELWAVELVGAKSTAKAWDQALVPVRQI